MIWLLVIVSFLLIMIWGGGYLLALFEVEVSFTLQLVATAMVLLGAGAWVQFRRYRAKKRAKELEAEILRQSEKQAAAARPDKRAEIIELQKRVQSGIRALQNTKIGKNYGQSALYALPWYAIIGPPGAGKTTALKHSGLVFPSQDAGGTGVRGVGGTRNCDWWFTNEGILLDTAGRYATDDADREEWLAFLGMLRKYRPKKPINGLLVALSISDLFEATDEQISTIANKLRSRVDEIMTRLDMVLPVYVIFTKADLIGGFAEFWGDIRKSDRDQILGATLPLDDAVAQAPGKAFAGEFDKLCTIIHSRSLKVIGAGPQADNRAKIFQFPLEFKGLKENTEQFIEELFRQNAFQENPMFRGFYFTSGTQEGTPFQRVMGNMARALGIRQVPSQQLQTESKSYFVTDVFRRVVFPDKNLAARTASELRRQKVLRAAIAAAAILIGSIVLLPGVSSMSGNRDLIKKTEGVSEDAAAVRWGSGEAAPKKVEKLDDAHKQLALLDGYVKEGPPIGLQWGMYQGDTLHPALLDAYAGHLERGMASPSRKKLELELKTIGMSQMVPSSQYGRMYDALKVYLMLTQPKFLDIDWATPRLTRIWAKLLRDESQDTQEAMTLHVRYYLELIKRGGIPAWPGEAKLVARARSVLLRAPQLDRIYDLLVREANEEVASIGRENIFYGSIGPFMTSKKELKVQGAYTREGWVRVRKLLNSEKSRLTGEKWVLGEEEVLAAKDIAKQIAGLRKLYIERFQVAWRAFLADLVVERPVEATSALDELNALSEPEWPYLRLLRILHEHVALDLEEPKSDELSGALVEKVQKKVEKKILGKSSEEKKPKRRISQVEKAFSPMTSFAVVPEGVDPSSTGLAQYQAILAKLVGVMSDLRDSDTPTNTGDLERDFQGAFRATSALLARQDGFTRPLLSPLLMRPIMGAWSGLSNDIGSAAGGLWELSVWEEWRSKLEPTFPFANTSKDAKLEEFVEFFQPKSGALWSFYEQNLKGAVKQRGERFVATRRFDSAVGYGGGFLENCLGRGKKITDAFFPDGSQEPKIEFQVNLHSVSRNVSEVSLTIDGVTHIYQNTPEEWLSGIWPATEGAPGVRVRIQGAGGLDEEIIREGEFGLFRLIDAASSVEPGSGSAGRAGGSTLVATYEFPSEKAFLMLDIRAKQGMDALTPGLFDNYKCPRVITTGTQ